MRRFSYITVGRLLSELREEGLPITRVTFYRLEKRLGLPSPHKTKGGWRVYTPSEMETVKQKIKEEYNFVTNPQ